MIVKVRPKSLKPGDRIQRLDGAIGTVAHVIMRPQYNGMSVYVSFVEDYPTAEWRSGQNLPYAQKIV